MGLAASCSDDSDYQPIAETTINITSAQTSLGPSASEGFVTVDCTPSAAYTDAPSWLTATIEGNSVRLASTANGTRESRNAKLVIKKSPSDSTIVSVSQMGLVLKVDKAALYINDDKAKSFTKSYESNTDIELLKTPEWAKVTIDKASKEIHVDVEENTTGHMRSSYIKFQAAAATDSFLVKQFDYDKDIAGNYLFGYYDFNEDNELELQYAEVTLDREKMDVPEWGFTFPVILNDTTGTVSLRSNLYLGTFGDYYAYTIYIAEDGNAYFNNNTGLLSSNFVYDDEMGTVGTFSGYAYNIDGQKSGCLGMLIGLFKANVPTPVNFVGNLNYILSPILLKYNPDEEEDPEDAMRRYAPVQAMRAKAKSLRLSKCS